MEMLDVVAGAQYGSEGKGHVAQQVIRQRLHDLADTGEIVLNVRVGGPNAGHTVIDDTNHRWAFRQLPVGASLWSIGRDEEDGWPAGQECERRVWCAIAAGSEIDLPVLENEISELYDAGRWGGYLIVDPEATVMDPGDSLAEQGRWTTGVESTSLVERIGSTGKGIGMARSRRILRSAKRVIDSPDVIRALARWGVQVRPVATMAQDSASVVIEGTQGYGLGLHAGHYPYATSADCRAIDFMAQAGVMPWQLRSGRQWRIWLATRPFPIRVAGNSGPLENETTWDALGLMPEQTTVTKKIRRVGAWDGRLVRAAVHANGGGHRMRLASSPIRLAITMLDHAFPNLAGTEKPQDVVVDKEAWDWLEQVQTETGAIVDLVTTGPRTAVWLEQLDLIR